MDYDLVVLGGGAGGIGAARAASRRGAQVEADAASRGARVAWLPMTEVGRAVVSGQTAGFVKLIVGPRPGGVAGPDPSNAPG